MNKLGGLAVVIQELNHPEPDIRMVSAWIIGQASQNNPVVQRQVLSVFFQNLLRCKTFLFYILFSPVMLYILIYQFCRGFAFMQLSYVVNII